jgi:hypothetical protein
VNKIGSITGGKKSGDTGNKYEAENIKRKK